MCLFKGCNKHKVAEEDIVCYKIVERWRDTGELESYYMGTPIELGESMLAWGYVHNTSRFSISEIIDMKAVLETEVIHTFAIHELDSVFEIVMREDSNDNSGGKREAVMIECVIPKGTIYVENIPNKNVYPAPRQNDFPQYGAVCVIPKRIIKVL